MRRRPLCLVILLAWLPAAAAQERKAPPRVSARELAAAYVKDPVEAGRRYGEPVAPREVLVEGVVAEVVDGKGGRVARLQGAGKVVVACALGPDDAGRVKPGQKVTVRGRCRGFFERDNLVDVRDGVVQKGP